MEIADIFVVNKADRSGAEQLMQEVDVMLGLRQGNAYRLVEPHHTPDFLSSQVESVSPDTESVAWVPLVLGTVALMGEGVPGLVQALQDHYSHLQASGELDSRRRERLERHTRDVVDRTLSSLVWQQGDGERILADGMDGVVSGITSPYRLAQDIVAGVRQGGFSDEE
jgi:LAO/AO transport system kinase